MKHVELIMKTLRQDSIPNQLNRSRVLIRNTIKNTDILTLVTPKGYTLEVMNEGFSLFNKANAAVDAAAEKSGAQALASDFAGKTQLTAQEAYQDLAKVARAIFLRDPATLTSLGLDKAMPRAEAAFSKAFDKLFNTGGYTPEIRAKLLKKGYDDAKLSLDRSKLGEWIFAKETQTTCTGDAQAATETQKKALAAMVDWAAEYIKIARVALKKQSQLLEKLGIVVRSSRTKAQRGAAAKAAATRLKKKLAVATLKAA